MLLSLGSASLPNKEGTKCNLENRRIWKNKGEINELTGDNCHYCYDRRLPLLLNLPYLFEQEN